MDAVDRRAAVLRAIVEEYVETAQPVASQTIAQSRSLGVSSATVRNDMTQLEREGYIVQPHTSAGRIPTDQGYRYFVDHFTAGAVAPGQPAARRRRLLRLRPTARSRTCSTRRASCSPGSPATPPSSSARSSTPARVRSVQLVALQPELVLAIAVLSNGSIEKEVISNAGDFDDDADRPGQRRARRDAARAVARQRRPSPSPTSDPVVDELVRLGVEALSRRAASGRRAALRRRREPDRRRAGRVRDRRAGVAPPRDARAAGRRGRRSSATCSTRASP